MDPQRLALRVASNSKFSGQSDENWEKWLSHFELRFRDVEKEQRGGILIDLLDGVALDECAKLASKELQDYDTIKKSLQDRFGGEVDTLQAYAELAQARQEPGEGVEAFGDRVMELLEKSFPSASPVQKQEHGLKQFVCGLSDEKLQEKLIAKDKVVSLKAAVQVAKQLKAKENVLEAVRGKKAGGVAMTACQGRAPSRTREDEDSELNWTEMKTQLTQIQSTIAQLEAKMADQGRVQNIHEATGVSRRPRGCYQCGQLTHFKRQCPQLAGLKRGGQGVDESESAVSRRRQPWCVACGRQGHWMSQCWRIQHEAGSGEQSHMAPHQSIQAHSNQTPLAASFRADQGYTDQGNE